MTSRSELQNGGFNARTAHASYGPATAGGTGDNTEVDGVYADRMDSASGLALSAKLVISYRAVLAQAATLSITANIQDNTVNSGGSPVDYGPAFAKTVVATGGTGGSTEVGTIELDFDLASAERYVRSQITPDLSAANTDTAIIWATWVFFGAGRGPMTKTRI